jgi:hypothetical protein
MTDDQKQKPTTYTPWPESEENATADAMIVHAAAGALAESARAEVAYREYAAKTAGTPAAREAARRWMSMLAQMIASTQIATALVETQKVDRGRADALAALLWVLTEDGGAIHELPWEYLEARGIDPQVIVEEANAAAKRAVAPDAPQYEKPFLVNIEGPDDIEQFDTMREAVDRANALNASLVDTVSAGGPAAPHMWAVPWRTATYLSRSGSVR